MNYNYQFKNFMGAHFFKTELMDEHTIWQKIVIHEQVWKIGTRLNGLSDIKKHREKMAGAAGQYK